MNPSERRRVVRRRHVIVLAPVLLAGLTACADQPAAPSLTVDLPVKAPHSPVRSLRLVAPLHPSPRVSHKPAPTHALHAKPTPKPHIGTALHITIPSVWARLVQCESSGHWAYGKPGGYVDPGYANYEGGPNFVHSTWVAHGGTQFARHAYDASPLQQIVVAKRVLRSEGVRAWPVCGPRVGLSLADAA